MIILSLGVRRPAEVMRVGILAAVIFSSTIEMMPSALAQATPEEHEGQLPPSEALGWFKAQLNLLPTQMDLEEARILGMTPFQLFLRALMVAAISVSLAMYVLRMRRASYLIERIVDNIKGIGWYQSH